ncbi:DUF4412 domain-containing protein [bacterium]|nr:DUF4412 domain-containing protein [bacterium]
MRHSRMMNLIASIFVFAMICFLSISTCYCDWYVEQKLTSKSGANPETTTMQKLYFKDKMMKIESDTDNADIYYRLDKDVIWFTNRKNKTYWERKLSQTMQIMKMFKQDQQIDLKDTGNKKKIGKYDCKEYLITSKSQLMNYTQELWVTKDIKLMKDYGELIKAYQQYSTEMQEKLASIDGYPVLDIKTSSYMGTEVVNTSEITKIEEKKLDAKIFDIPAGYKLEEPPNPFANIQKQMEEQKSGTPEAAKESPPAVKEEKTETK